jgi:outer membrane protein assembly factor BamB
MSESTITMSDLPKALWQSQLPVRGRILPAGDLMLVTLDARTHVGAEGQAERLGVAALSLDLGDIVWTRWSLPPLAAVGADSVYLYGRAGLVVTLALDGREKWRTSLPDDRSPASVRSGDPLGPFYADVVVGDGTLYVPAGPEIVAIETSTGALRVQRSVCAASRGVVVRLVRCGGDIELLATCNARSDDDDSSVRRSHVLWEADPPPEALRVTPGDLVAVGTTLDMIWRLSAPRTDQAYGDASPTVMEDGAIAVIASRVNGAGEERALSNLASWLLMVAKDGSLRWRREIPGGYRQPDPIAVLGGVVAGFDPTLYDVADGRVRWTVDSASHQLNRTVPLCPYGENLIAVGAGELLAIACVDGSVRPVARFSAAPFHGCVTTPVRISGTHAYLGVEQPGEPPCLVAALLTG